MTLLSCKLLVLGAGPGGYVCAIRAGQLGLDTIVIEAAGLGGTCLNVGCIPSKALIHVAEEFERIADHASAKAIGISVGVPTLDLAAAIAWKDGIVARLSGGVHALLRRAKVRVVQGRARFVDGKTVEVDAEDGPLRIRCETVVIATGSVPVELANLPFGGDILSSSGALALSQVPPRLAVVGGGYIGLELGTAFAKLGSKVTVLEARDGVLPQYDTDLVRPVAAKLEELGVRVITGAVAGTHVEGALSYTKNGETHRVAADKVLVTVGRKAKLEGWGLERLDLKMKGRSLWIDDRCRTSMTGVYAIGDVTGDPMLAHRAMAQGHMVAELAAGLPRRWDKQCVPAICFTDPEIVTAGLSPSEALLQGLDTYVAQFAFAANARAMTTDATNGFVRIVSRATDHLILGIQAVGSGISELSVAFTVAIEAGLRLEDVAGTVHAHPARGEALQEAAMKAMGRALHG